MEEFFYLYVIILFFVLREVLMRKVTNKGFCLCAFLMLAMVGLRDIHCGADTWNYCDFFVNPKKSTTYYSIQGVEPGFRVLNSIIGIFSHNENFYLFVTALITFCPIYWYIGKYSSCKVMSLFVFLTFGTATMMYFMSFYLMRQYLSIAFLSLAIVFYKKNNEKINKNVVLLYCIALSMHIASLIFLPVFYKYKSVSKKNVILLFVITFVIGSITTHYFSDFYALGALIGKGQYLQNNAERFYQYMMTLPLFALGTMFVLFTDEGHLKLIEYRSLYFAVVFNNLFSIVDYSDRTIVYFLFPLLVLIPNAFNYMKIKILYKVIAFAVFVAYYSYKYYSVLSLYSEFQNDSPVPYRSCLY